MKYEIWTNNGTSVFFESGSDNFNVVLDEFCSNAGYIDHADCCKKMNIDESPFNIREIPNE